MDPLGMSSERLYATNGRAPGLDVVPGTSQHRLTEDTIIHTWKMKTEAQRGGATCLKSHSSASNYLVFPLPFLIY